MAVTITVQSVSLNMDSNIPCLVPSLQYGTPPWAKRLDRRLWPVLAGWHRHPRTLRNASALWGPKGLPSSALIAIHNGVLGDFCKERTLVRWAYFPCFHSWSQYEGHENHSQTNEITLLLTACLQRWPHIGGKCPCGFSGSLRRYSLPEGLPSWRYLSWRYTLIERSP